MTPIARLAAAFALGIAAGLRTGDPRLFAAVAIAAALGLALRLAVPVRTRRWAPAVGAFAAGALHGGFTADSALSDCRARFPDGARLDARIEWLGPPVAGGSVDAFVEALTVDGRPTACAGTIRVRLPAGWEGGAAMHARVAGVWWSDPVVGRWPTPPERRGVLAARSVAASDDRGHRHPLTRIRFTATATADTVFARERGLAQSMLLARRDDLDPDVRQAFSAAGLSHTLAISGAHVGVLAAVVLLVARLAGAGARLAPVLAAAGTVGYVVFLGAPPAAARAAMQALLLLASRALQRPADPLGPMAFAATLLLLARPFSLLEPGFQLSFAGVFGLIAFREPIGLLLPERLPRAVRDATAATLAASLATAPIAAWHFGLVSLVGPLANLVAAPLMALALPASALALIAGLVDTRAGAFLGGGAGLLLGGLRVVAQTAARPEAGHAWVTPSGVWAALLGVAIAYRLAPVPRVGTGLEPGALRRALRIRLQARAGAALAAATLVLAFGPTGRGALEIHAIDVGQGDALAIRTPRGRWVVIDAGPRTAGYDAGQRRVAPYLLERGARRIEALILTHPDADHVGGAQWLWRAFDIGAVLEPALATGKEVYLDALVAARTRGTPWLAAREGRAFGIDGVAFRILAPSDGFLDRPRDANESSVVVRLEYGSFGALFLGDAPMAVEDALVERFGSAVRSDLIKVGHHGSRTSTGDSLLGAVRPVVALISVGRRNRYGHPAPAVLRRLEDYGVRVLRTDEGGSVEVRVRPGSPLEVRRRR